MRNINLTKNYYDGISKGYKELYHQEQIKKIEKIINFLPKEGILLDLGSGDGVLNQFIDKKVKIISFDLSTELLKLNPNIQKNKFQGNSEELPFEDEHFDFISTFTMLQDVKKPIKTINEIYRTLKKNSSAIISYLKNSDDKELIYKHINKKFIIEKEINEEKDIILKVKK